jgi:type IV pilus assembly protein PilP
LPGNHLGQNDGKILRITPSTIELIEIVPDGLGGYFERPAAVALDSK